MQAIRGFPTTLPASIQPTFNALIPHLDANKHLIHKQYARREEHPYGLHPRQKLDVYYPHNVPATAPVLLFLYGGGFFQGNKRDPRFPDLIYANLGAFFANKGFITIVADYRLSKGPGNPTGDARYPSGGEDTVGAINWITTNLGGDRQIFLMGNSAGAVHVMTFLFEPSLRNSVKANVAGAVLLSPPSHQRAADASRTEVNAAYYGDIESIEKNSPIGLMSKNGPVSIPILSMVADLDEDSIKASWKDFKEEYAKQGGKLDEIIFEGNHISPVPGLNGTDPAGSTWGEDAAEWMLKQLKT